MATFVGSVSSVVVPVEVPEPVDLNAVKPAAANDLEDPGRYRLSIESLSPGRFVYKVIDRVTGEVIRQLPREDVQKLMADPQYKGGGVIDTKA